jgi:hypothetical protein
MHENRLCILFLQKIFFSEWADRQSYVLVYTFDCTYCILSIVTYALYSWYCILCIVFVFYLIHCILSIELYYYYFWSISLYIYCALCSMHCNLNMNIIPYNVFYALNSVHWSHWLGLYAWYYMSGIPCIVFYILYSMLSISYIIFHVLYYLHFILCFFIDLLSQL